MEVHVGQKTTTSDGWWDPPLRCCLMSGDWVVFVCQLKLPLYVNWGAFTLLHY